MTVRGTRPADLFRQVYSHPCFRVGEPPLGPIRELMAHGHNRQPTVALGSAASGSSVTSGDRRDRPPCGQTAFAWSLGTAT